MMITNMAMRADCARANWLTWPSRFQSGILKIPEADRWGAWPLNFTPEVRAHLIMEMSPFLKDGSARIEGVMLANGYFVYGIAIEVISEVGKVTDAFLTWERITNH